jgi:serine/threonine protein kinase
MLSPDTILQHRYRVVRQLGQGGMSTVYEAIDERVSAVVVLKEANIATDDSSRREFESEARLLANLQHQALPKVMDYFTEGDVDYLVMEYIPGYDLLELLRRRGAPFHVDLVLHLADELLDVLVYLHGSKPPILHRDIKPANLKLTQREEVYLLDFGLAKGTAGKMEALITNRSVRGYTPFYAPLEQILRQGTDARSDLYSLGATLYHLLTGTPPVDAPTRDAHIEGGKPDPLLPIQQLNPQVPPGVANVVRQAMAIRRKDRFQSAAIMRRSLSHAREEAKRGAVGAEGHHAAGPKPREEAPAKVLASQPPRSKRTPQGSKSLLLYLFLALAALIVGGGTVVWFKSGDKNGSVVSTPTPEVTTEEKEQQVVPTTPTPTPTPTPQVKLIDVSGEWNGFVTGGAEKTTLWKMVLSQTGERVEGILGMSSSNDSAYYYSIIKIEGKVSGNRFNFAGTQFVEDSTGPDFRWCLPTGDLQYAESNGTATLEGTWGSNEKMEGGCPKGSQGRIKMSR